MTPLKRIKDLVEQKGMTIAELEHKADLGNGTIRNWDKNLPSVDKMQRVARILDTTIDYLMTSQKENLEQTKILAIDLNELNNTQIQLIQDLINEMKNK